jgi:phosphoribosylformylglycinamidine synthase
MKILVIGSGGREHALVWKISSPKTNFLRSRQRTSENWLNASPLPNRSKTADLPERKNDLTVVGPELPPPRNNRFFESRIQNLGPNKAAARLKGSKVAKEILQQNKFLRHLLEPSRMPHQLKNTSRNKNRPM